MVSSFFKCKGAVQAQKYHLIFLQIGNLRQRNPKMMSEVSSSRDTKAFLKMLMKFE